MKQAAIILICLALSGCGFKGELTRTEAGFKWDANRPCLIKQEGIEIDGKGEPIALPDIVGTKLGR